MDQYSMDPYERQLFAVFTTFADGSGTLDSSSMTELCGALQMEAGSTGELVALANKPGERVPFPRFRDALLKVLGGGGDGIQPSATSVQSHSDEESSERELSPKLVYGSKKYGRRSRPRVASAKQSSQQSTGIETRPAGVRRAISSPGDGGRSILTMELDRCESVPNDQEQYKRPDLQFCPLELDHNRTVDCDEAMALCRSMQMGNVNADMLRQIFDEGGDIGKDERITVGEFFHRLNKKLINSITLESGDIAAQSSQSVRGPSTWNASNEVDREFVIEMWERAGIVHCRQMLHDLGFSGKRVRLTKLSSALDKEIKSLLSDVDKSSETNVPSLLLQASLSLHRHELRCIRDTMEQVFAENSKMKTDLSEANQRAQMLAQEVDDNHAQMESSLKNKVKQLELKHAEMARTAEEERAREKEATSAELSRLQERLSALEVEESKLRSRYSSLERSNEELERRLATSYELTLELEQVRTHLTRELRALTTERDQLRDPGRDRIGEIEKLTALVSDFRLENKSLRDKNDELCVEIEDLQGKLTRETRRLSLGRSKPQCRVDISSEQAISLLEECDGWSGGGEVVWDVRRDGTNAIKRRGDSPSKGQYSLFEDESPRIGKLRRCHTEKDEEQVRNEMGQEWELDSFSEGGSCPLDPSINFVSHTESHADEMNRDIKRLKPRFKNAALIVIKQIIDAVNKQELNNCESCNTLKDILSMIHKQIDNVEMTTAEEQSDHEQSVDKPTTEATATQTDEQVPVDSDNYKQHIDAESERKKLEEEKKKLTNMCRDLETSLEQLKTEYDKCEEYWTNKLEEEREIFNEEQRISDEKFTDLLSKISDYEEQFSPRQKCGSKLPTIDEKYSLELQFTELEEEFQLYRQEKMEEIEEKVKEINLLKEQLKHLEQLKINILPEDNVAKLNDVPDKIYDSKVNIISNEEELEPSIPQMNSPIGYLWNQSTIQSPIIKQELLKRDSTRDYQNPAFAKSTSQNESVDDSAKSCSDNERESSSLNPIKKPTVPKRCNSADLLNNPSVGIESHGYDAWCGNPWPECSQGAGNGGPATGMIQCSDLEGQLRRNAQQSQDGSGMWSADGQCGNRRSAEVACLMLEQHCRQLQLSVRQHQIYLATVQQKAQSESSDLRQKLFNAESAIVKLQQRLTSADMLVKELYVENCQLLARKPQLL